MFKRKGNPKKISGQKKQAHGCFVDVSRMFKACIGKVAKIFQECFKGIGKIVSKVFK